ncbi:hypothetical protein GDO81_006542 [Engystomops pustulosus]|uniref:Uncharacterized protein n=1 Tax=Engystomops pustulosus TaxID=76066 RepID=A0AAV7CY83_ENGPU|nr:hypothetical protein GDO81_006542 [Engystomops pustulosus]
MTEQGERRINQPQCDPTGEKNSTPTSRRWGKGSTCNQGNVASCTHALLFKAFFFLPFFFFFLFVFSFHGNV